MKAEDMPIVSAALGRLASIYNRRPPNEVASTAWYQHLRDYPIEVVAWVLDEWPAQHEHFPAISQVRKACSDEHNRRLQARDKRVSDADGQSWRPALDTPAARNAIALIRAIKASPRPDPRAWSAKYVERAERGERCQVDMLRAAIAISGRRPDLAPSETESEREARLEREAIMAESEA